jgi:hypothetical protein
LYYENKQRNILEKYDTKEYENLCDGLSNIIREKQTSSDFLAIYSFYDKIDSQDRDIIEQQVGNQISNVLFCI